MALNAAVHTLMNWLEDHRDQSLLIHKHEQDDSDHVRINLSGVDFKPETASIDGYTDESALRLHGEGTVLNDGQSLPLSQNAYVIPVDGLTLMELLDTRMIMRTNIAEYTMYID
ncbi:hypothetical protein [Cohnella yongneupensis]|uniref:Uncharacterized protein n=1 Tax=Cohnella yongneupensis TaxID=425006 RepID=A0ABW0QS92_9BACL